MGKRLDYGLVSPNGIRSLRDLETYLHGSDLEPALLELVKLRASILNGCAFCIDMHSKEARARGEMEQRLYGSPLGGKRPFSASANARCWPGPTPSPASTKASRTRSMQTSAVISRRRNWWI